MCYLGAWRDVRALGGIKRAVVYPVHPCVVLMSAGLGAPSVRARPGGSAPSAEEVARGAEEGDHVQRLALLRGEFRPLQLSIENVGESPIVAMCVSIAVEYDDDSVQHAHVPLRYVRDRAGAIEGAASEETATAAAILSVTPPPPSLPPSPSPLAPIAAQDAPESPPKRACVGGRLGGGRRSKRIGAKE